MFSSKAFRITLVIGFITLGVWLMSRSSGLSPETVTRFEAQQLALAPGRSGISGSSADLSVNDPRLVKSEAVAPISVDVRDLPSRAHDFDPFLKSLEEGRRDFETVDGPLNDSTFQALVAESAKQGVESNIQNYSANLLASTLTGGTNWDAIQYNESQAGVPPDPDLTVGRDHVIVGVNTSFQIFDKTGTSLVGPTLFDDFWGNNCGTGAATMSFFDPFLDYDEKEGRYILGITAYDTAVNGGDNGYACIAVSQADNAAGQWWLYSFDGNPGGGSDYFFDYPHLGVGQDALYLSANMFGASFVRNHVMAFDKFAMYAGQSANSVKINVGSNNFTLQPAKMHGYDHGGWPTNANEPHYFVDAQYGNNQNTLTVWQFSDPFGSASLTQAGTVNVNSYSLPVSQPQQGNSSNLEGNDDRLLDVKYWDGKLYATHTIGCNPGGGTVNCIRWYIIDIGSGSPSLADQGTFASSGVYRSFPAIAPNACGDLMVGYTQTNNSMYPSVYVAGREAADASGQLKNETLLKAGEDPYFAYDVPQYGTTYRWGDYTGMGIDPDGVTFWYVGEYSRDQANADWATWVGSYTFPDCNVGPTPTPGPTATATNTPPPPTPTNTPVPTTCTTYSSADTPINMPNGTSTISSDIAVSGSGAIQDVNVSVDMPHVWVGDLKFTVSKGATSALIIDQPGAPASTYGCSGDDILATLDDAAALPVEGQCGGSAPTINGTFSPNNPLNVFNGQSGNGTWTLTVEDTYTSADAGSLSGWSVEVCVEDTGSPTSTPVPPTATSMPPTATDVPPTATDVPPTATSVSPTATDVPPTATDVPPTDTPVPPTATSIPPTATPPPTGGDLLYVSSTSGGNAGGVSFADEDILEFDTDTGTWSMYFDGSDVGLSGSGARDVNAFALLSDGTILLSFNGATTIPDVGSVDDSDIVQFTPTSLGTTTAGTFALFFDGSDVGLTTNGEDIDAMGVSPSGDLVISTIGSHSVTGASGVDEDLLIFTNATFGAATSGTWAPYFDGSDVDLGGVSTEDVYGTWIDDGGDIYLTTRGTYAVTGLGGDGDDIFVCTPGSTDSTTSCTYSLYWDGDANGYGSEIMDGFVIVR